MFRGVCVSGVAFFVFLLRLSAFTQQSLPLENSPAVADSDQQAPTAQPSAMRADRLPLPEARLMIELFVARGVLDEKHRIQTSSNHAPDSRDLVTLERQKLR